MVYRYRYVVLVFFNVINFSTFAQQYKAPAEIVLPKKLITAIDSIFGAYADRVHSPGLVYGIVSNGKLIHKGSTGYTDVDKKTKADINSAFRIASMSKSFTAMAILQLRDQGKLNLDDPVHKYITVTIGKLLFWHLTILPPCILHAQLVEYVLAYILLVRLPAYFLNNIPQHRKSHVAVLKCFTGHIRKRYPFFKHGQHGIVRYSKLPVAPGIIFRKATGMCE